MLKIRNSAQALRAVSAVINESGCDGFAAELLVFLNRFVRIDHCVAATYQRGVGVHTLFTEGSVPAHQATDLAREYEREYFRDPNFPALQNPDRQGDDVIPFSVDNISDDDYIDYFYTKAGIVDKVSTIARVGKNRVLCSFYRILPTPPYDRQAWDTLNDLLPVATELIVNHYRLLEGIRTSAGQGGQAMPFNQFIHAMISREMAPFSKLTQRERDICERTLLGKTAKEVATDLHIAESTVITHRKRSYNKLGISTHKELFTLFLGAGEAGTVCVD